MPNSSPKHLRVTVFSLVVILQQSRHFQFYNLFTLDVKAKCQRGCEVGTLNTLVHPVVINSVETFMVPRGCLLMTLVVP